VEKFVYWGTGGLKREGLKNHLENQKKKKKKSREVEREPEREDPGHKENLKRKKSPGSAPQDPAT